MYKSQSSLEQLKEMGESLGLTGDKLMQFIKDQQAEERSRRAADREHEKLRMQNELEDRKLKAEQEAREKELEAKAKEREKDRELELKKLEFQQEKLKVDAQLATAKLNKSTTGSEHEDSDNEGSTTSHHHIRGRTPKLPFFEENKDDRDAYLFRF